MNDSKQAELHELVGYWKMLTEKPLVGEFDRGVRAARLEVIDALLGVLGTDLDGSRDR